MVGMMTATIRVDESGTIYYTVWANQRGLLRQSVQHHGAYKSDSNKSIKQNLDACEAWCQSEGWKIGTITDASLGDI